MRTIEPLQKIVNDESKSNQERKEAAELILKLQGKQLDLPKTRELADEDFFRGRTLERALRDHYNYITKPSQKSEENFAAWREGKNDLGSLKKEIIEAEESSARNVIVGEQPGFTTELIVRALCPLLFTSGRLRQVGKWWELQESA